MAIVSFRGASLALPSGDYLIRAALTLAVAVSMQSLIMGVYLGLFEAGELRRVVRAWRPASVVGLTGMLASAILGTLMVPAAFAAVQRFREWLKSKLGATT